MRKDFRILTLSEQQVLLQKDIAREDDDKPFLLYVIFYVNDVLVDYKLGYDNEGERDKLFDDFTIEHAQELIIISSGMLKEENEEK